LSSFWKKLGTPYLDLSEVLAPHASEALVVNGHDSHPNERAHALAADAIDGFLRAELGPAQPDRER